MVEKNEPKFCPMTRSTCRKDCEWWIENPNSSMSLKGWCKIHELGES
jgi:hypothetical protein